MTSLDVRPLTIDPTGRDVVHDEPIALTRTEFDLRPCCPSSPTGVQPTPR